MKVAFHTGGRACTPDGIDRTVSAEEVHEIASVVKRHLPTLPGAFLRAATCMYTDTADESFVVAPHPEEERVVLACGFSGHGFKFAPVIGEIVADLVIDGATDFPIARFDPARLRV